MGAARNRTRFRSARCGNGISCVTVNTQTPHASIGRSQAARKGKNARRPRGAKQGPTTTPIGRQRGSRPKKKPEIAAMTDSFIVPLKRAPSPRRFDHQGGGDQRADIQMLKATTSRKTNVVS